MRIAAKKLITSTTYVKTNFWEDGTTVVSMCFSSLYAKLALSGMEIYSFIQPFSEKFLKNVDYSFFPPLFPALRSKMSKDTGIVSQKERAKGDSFGWYFSQTIATNAEHYEWGTFCLPKRELSGFTTRPHCRSLPHENQRPRPHYTQPASHREHKTRVFKRLPIFS